MTIVDRTSLSSNFENNRFVITNPTMPLTRWVNFLETPYYIIQECFGKWRVKWVVVDINSQSYREADPSCFPNWVRLIFAIIVVVPTLLISKVLFTTYQKIYGTRLGDLATGTFLIARLRENERNNWKSLKTLQISDRDSLQSSNLAIIPLTLIATPNLA